ncbi:hypothetical protein V1511DRAFT_455910 [Dipodascopsis uninucleata]
MNNSDLNSISSNNSSSFPEDSSSRDHREGQTNGCSTPDTGNVRKRNVIAEDDGKDEKKNETILKSSAVCVDDANNNRRRRDKSHAKSRLKCSNAPCDTSDNDADDDADDDDDDDDNFIDLPDQANNSQEAEVKSEHDRDPSSSVNDYIGWTRLLAAADGILERLRPLRPSEDERHTETETEPESAGEHRPKASVPSTPKRPVNHRRSVTASSALDGFRHRIPHPKRHTTNSSVYQSNDLDNESGYIGAQGSSSDHQAPMSARWRDLRTTLRFINFTKKKKDEEIKRDRDKSAELIGELAAGTPAAIILASYFKRDERNRRRIPVLLEQLKVRIPDSTRTEDRQHTLFRIELEYGSGPTRMRWVVHRDFRDFVNLHSRLRVIRLQNNISTTAGTHSRLLADLPHFPRHAIPYLRGVRGLTDLNDNDTNFTALNRLGRLSRHSLLSILPDASVQEEENGNGNTNSNLPNSHSHGHNPTSAHRNSKFIETQRQSLEDYLKQLVRVMTFSGEANRICKFLELSALDLRLSIENSYHGKEGPLTIISTSSSQGWHSQKINMKNIKSMFRRYGSRWIMVRHSYIVIVDSILDVVPLDVFIVDADFKFSHKPSSRAAIADSEKKHRSIKKSVQESAKLTYTLTLQNAERHMKLLAPSEKHMQQFLDSIDYMQRNTPWSKTHRFDSFAPVRYNVLAQWFVDGRDYYWNVSRAIDMARDVIYIHDWWLSPEIYLRRPAHGNQQWRLDRLLKRKAEEGVKIFVILYRNVGAAIPIDSQYTKQSLLDLHPNIFVARSPNQFRQNILFWAHHEKLVLIDHVIGFVGGLDLCFGRWDTPQHVLSDDKPTGFDRGSKVDFGEETQLWVGKDYSNARVQDFYELDKPYDDMYDRSKVPRMPWHDVHMQLVGQPARDASRHFVQRWNYLIRQKRSSRPTPTLLPPPDFTDAELEALGHLGTCEVQLLRSACSWSLGFQNDKIEHSIVNAYLKTIEQSEHFVYIENQFFITSTSFDGTVIHNEIGDALVERIVRAHKHDEDWRAVIIIPLMPGFEAEVDHHDGTSVRLIMQCQFRSISRGPYSVFGRLERAGINADDYIQFFSLRKWGKIGPTNQLVTEQLYIHAKIMIVDDRVAIIGSANINERSMRGSRDSEVAAFVRDTDQMESRMAGEPYMVGRFPHTLRVRLMREHLGIDVDALEEVERCSVDSQGVGDIDSAFDVNKKDIWQKLEDLQNLGRRPQTIIDDNDISNQNLYDATSHSSDSDESSILSSDARSVNSAFRSRSTGVLDRAEDPTVSYNSDNSSSDGIRNHNPGAEGSEVFDAQKREIHAADLAGFGPDRMIDSEQAEENMRNAIRERQYLQNPSKSNGENGEQRDIALPVGVDFDKSTDADQSKDDVKGGVNKEAGKGIDVAEQMKILKSLILEPARSYLSDAESLDVLETQNDHLKKIDPLDFEDPLDESFYYDLWLGHAMNNTNIFREVFRCQPDNEVRTWKDYKAYHAYAEKFSEMQRGYTNGPVKVPAEEKANGRKRGNSSAAMDSHNHISQSGSAAGGAGGIPIRAPSPILTGIEGVKELASVASPDSNTNNSLSKGAEDDVLSEKTALSPDNTEDSLLRVKTSASQLNGRRRRRGQTIDNINSAVTTHSKTRRSRRRSHAEEKVLDKSIAEKMLQNVRGHLIVFPTDWLLKEDEAGNWFYNIDRIPPIEIYD